MTKKEDLVASSRMFSYMYRAYNAQEIKYLLKQLERIDIDVNKRREYMKESLTLAELNSLFWD